MSEGGVVYWNPDVSKANYDLHLPITCLWYLYTLYIVSIVFYLIVDKTIIKLSRFLLLVSALLILSFITGQFIGHTLPYAIQSLPLMLAIMLTGAFFAKRKELDRPIENAKTKNIIIILTIAGEGIVFGFSMLCYFAFQAPMVGALAAGAFNDVIKGFDAFITFIMTISGTFFIHNLMRLLSKVKFLSIFFGFFGKRVALLYVTHPIFLSYIHTIIFGRDYHVLGKFQPYAYMLLTLILFTGISLLISLITKKKSTKIVSEVGNEN